MLNILLLAATLGAAPPDAPPAQAVVKQAKKKSAPAANPKKPADERWPDERGFLQPSTEPGGEYAAGRSLHAAGRHREAMLFASSLLVIDRSHAGAWHLLGNCRWALGEKVAAREAWARALKLQPDPDLAKYMKAKHVIDPPPVPQAYRTALVESLAAKALLEAGQFDAAARRAEAATKLDPLSPADWDLLGDCRKAARDPDGARAAWTRAVKLAPKDKRIREKLVDK